MSDQDDYKDYQDYLEYQKHVAGTPQSTGPVSVQAGAFGRMAGPTSVPQGTADKVQQGLTNSLPLAGGIAGSAAFGPVGAPAGAAAGSMLKNIVTGDNSSPADAIKDVGSDAITQGVLPEVGGQALGLAGKALGKVGNVIGTAARRSGILDQVKAPAGLARSVKDSITDALGKFNENSIKPESDKLRQFLSDKTVSVNPGDLRGVDPTLDRYADVLKNHSKFDSVPVDASATAVNRAKQIAADAANYAKSKPFAEGSVAKEESAQKLADMLRGKVSDLGPEVGESNSKLQDMIQTRNRVRDASDTSPIETIQGRIGGTKSSITADIDKGAGTNLGQLGKDIELAQTRLGQKGVPESFAALAHHAIGFAPRVGGAIAQKIQPFSQAVTDPIAQGMQSELAKQGVKLSPSMFRALIGSQGE